jgi:predicted metal-dependent hydrolase
MSKNEIHFVRFGNNRITFELNYSERKTLGISVLPDSSVIVTSPEGKEIELVKSKVKQRASWILKQQDYFQNYSNLKTERQYVSGESHYYLGRQYRLKIIEDSQESVKFQKGYIFVKVSEKKNKERIKVLLDEWYLEKARQRFRKQLKECWGKVRKYEIAFPKLYIRKMSKRWGTCGTSNNVYLNPNLIKTPSICIEYVIIHELCHLKSPYHNKAFFDLLEKILPDWEKRKSKLEMIGQYLD